MVFVKKEPNTNHHHLLHLHSKIQFPHMANTGDDHKNSYWDNNRYHNNDDNDLDLDSWVDEALSGCYDSSSPDGAASSEASKNIVSERNRRKKLNDNLYALRSVVPNISKMDKASIIKDAIDYIQELQEQERRIQEEIALLESTVKIKGIPGFEDYDDDDDDGELLIFPPYLSSKKKRTIAAACGFFDSASSRPPPIEVLEMRVMYMGEKTVVVSLTCIKRTHTMVQLCQVFESLNLKVITANMTAFSGRLLKTLFIQADEHEKEELKFKIEAAIAAMKDPQGPMII